MLLLLTLVPLALIGFIVNEVDDDDDNSPAEQEGDTLTGGDTDDVIEGTTGNDVVQAGDGNDVVFADAGSDQGSGGAGNDIIDGGAGNDDLNGSLGRDWIDGDNGNDTINGGFGEDTLLGGAGADSIDGGAGDDLIFGGDISGVDLNIDQATGILDGSLTFEQAAGLTELDDNILPLSDADDDVADTLVGGDGNDSMIIGSGDQATGGAGFDDFVILADSLDNAPNLSTVTDFVPGEDAIVVLDDLDLPDAPTISVLTSGEDAVVALNGTPVTVVQGAAGNLSAEDIAFFTGISIGFLDTAP